jgi:hypothetical protein
MDGWIGSNRRRGKTCAAAGKFSQLMASILDPRKRDVVIPI